MQKQCFILDTSAILSGISLNLGDGLMVTTPKISQELRPGGRSYRTFEMLLGKGLSIQQPSSESLCIVQKAIKKMGETHRLSDADCEILALAYDIKNQGTYAVILLSDDYSIQNIASELHIVFQSVSHQGITKKFKWNYRCPGCKKTFTTAVEICPICGTQTKRSVQRKEDIS
ncbi:MAG: nucleic acid-binding protein [Candidatus Thermoplasmatota archaeon]